MSNKKLYKLCITIVLLITITFGFYVFFSTSEDISLTNRVLQPFAHIKCKLAVSFLNVVCIRYNFYND